MTDAQVTALFALLAAALARFGLARHPGEATTHDVDPGEFMYMNTAKGHHYFKHCGSRNYVLVPVDGEGLLAPATDKPFFRGDFPSDAEMGL
jgi:hypothetical protein